MHISIRNLPDVISRKEVKFATKFFANMLMSSRLCDTLEITIKFGTLKGCKACVWQDTDCPRNFLIEIRKTLSRVSILRALAHEMIHAKQYSKGELKEYKYDNEKSRFKGKVYQIRDKNLEDYFFAPWEIESYGMEVGLYYFYKKALKELAKNDRIKRNKNNRRRTKVSRSRNHSSRESKLHSIPRKS